ncbi:MAG TPA: hypothetical protein VFE24_03525 [Pirellulales bacterium]|nr:hypothetical protein [Pirellulales bacterium]
MDTSTSEAIIFAWALGVVQIVGVASALFARMSAGSTAQASCQRWFFVCLAALGCGTMSSLYYLGPGYWLLSAATLAVMILIVTCDFGEHRLASDRSAR